MRDHLTTRASDGRSVTLRLLKPEDAPMVQEACSDPETVKWLGSDIINEHYSQDHAHGFIEPHQRCLSPNHHARLDPDESLAFGRPARIGFKPWGCTDPG